MTNKGGYHLCTAPYFTDDLIDWLIDSPIRSVITKQGVLKYNKQLRLIFEEHLGGFPKPQHFLGAGCLFADLGAICMGPT